MEVPVVEELSGLFFVWVKVECVFHIVKWWIQFFLHIFLYYDII